MLLPLLLATTPLLGYFISSQTPDELAVGKKWFFTGSILTSLALFFLTPWWLAALATLGFAIGWLPGMFSMLLLLFFPAGWTLACIIAVLGILVGSRWRTEKRPLQQLLIASVALAVLAIALPQLI